MAPPGKYSFWMSTSRRAVFTAQVADVPLWSFTSCPQRTVQGGDLVEARLVTPALIGRVQPDVDAVERNLLGCRPTAKCKHVGVVVFLGHPCRVAVVDQRAADTGDLVGRDTGADAGTAEDDANCCWICHDLAAYRCREVGIVDGAFTAVGAQVLDLVALERQCMDEERLEAKTAVIGANDDLHVLTSV